MKTIGVLTSGGDAPGMNAAIRAVVRTACENGMKVYGINRGYAGLIDEDLRELNIRSVSDIIHRGGTMLHSARCLDFKEEAGMQKAIATCRKYGIEGIVVIGGDGSFRGARDLSLRGIPCVAIPGTIDNDIGCCDYPIAFDTAMNTIIDAIGKIRDTSSSHERVNIIEVMGRHCGDLALYSGICCGAEYIITKDTGLDKAELLDHLKENRLAGRKHAIIVISEKITDVHELAKEIEEFSKMLCEEENIVLAPSQFPELLMFQTVL